MSRTDNNKPDNRLVIGGFWPLFPFHLADRARLRAARWSASAEARLDAPNWPPVACAAGRSLQKRSIDNNNIRPDRWIQLNAAVAPAAAFN